jgi:hypothetical protein
MQRHNANNTQRINTSMEFESRLSCSPLPRLASESSIKPALHLHGSNKPTQLWMMRIRV